MDHRLIHHLRQAFDWERPPAAGSPFARGSLGNTTLGPRLLTPQRLLDLIMRRSLAHHRFRCLVDGQDLHPQRYIKMGTSRRGYAVPIADMDRLGALLESGCTIVLDQVNLYDPTLEVACRALQWWTGHTVQVNLYLTTGPADGFELHWDDHDVIVVQLAGDKSWEVRGPSRVAPLFRDAAPNFEPSDDTHWAGGLEAGEALYVPRGWWHRAGRTDRGAGYSLHASFGLHRRTGADWMTWLSDEARANELFRHDLDPDDRDGWLRHEDRLAAMAAQLAATRTPTEFLSARAAGLPAGRHIRTHGVFGEPEAVVCVTEFPPQIEHGDGMTAVVAAANRVTAPTNLWPAVELLTSGHPMRLDEVEAKTGLEVRPVASALVRAGICAEATPELLAGYAGLVS
ncbi:cupin domain-containing protein [Kibdelosporangium philippinense]|uniref:Cupin domain-containing protein n=2 Tax=Kibdelosporangium philippinense TaxID=211113 RepID=A0ABS8ZFN2_9PSEU|nr:cupin domain-containing protein [Kibdelosporangium philippinense]MCE7006590.1 cupin domain-containing protein [Kibdelosporangium philippinense]